MVWITIFHDVCWLTKGTLYCHILIQLLQYIRNLLPLKTCEMSVKPNLLHFSAYNFWYTHDATFNVLCVSIYKKTPKDLRPHWYYKIVWWGPLGLHSSDGQCIIQVSSLFCLLILSSYTVKHYTIRMVQKLFGLLYYIYV